MAKFLTLPYHISSISRSSSVPTGCTQNSQGLSTSVTTTSSLWPFLKGYRGSCTATLNIKTGKDQSLVRNCTNVDCSQLLYFLKPGPNEDESCREFRLSLTLILASNSHALGSRLLSSTLVRSH